MEDEKKLQEEVKDEDLNTDSATTDTNQDQEIVENKNSEDTATEEPQPTQPFKVFDSEDDFNKAIQSASSKAKGEILKELGIESVNAFKEQLTKVQESTSRIADYEAMQSRMRELETKNRNLEDNLLVAKYNLRDEAKEMFINLVRSSVKEGQSIEDVADKIYQTFQAGVFNDIPNAVIIGTDKQSNNDLGVANPQLDAFSKGLGL